MKVTGAIVAPVFGSTMAAKPKKKAKKNPSAKRRKNKYIPPSQTNEPFEQEADRPIGQHGAAGRPPLMKK
jgi:3'-phosphoadenosine 5'-phosphosulfate (PAPS) 3'-phosphatase